MRREARSRSDLPQELRDDLDLLTPGDEVRERDAGDTSHLDRVDDTHEFIEESEWQVGVFEAVDGKTAARLLRAVLVTDGQGDGQGDRQTG